MRPIAAAVADVDATLRCPHCLAAGDDEVALGRDDRVWRCSRGHSFDVARQGYVNLAGGTRHVGDTAAMLDARRSVLAQGLFDAVDEAIVGACRDAPDGALVEVGAGDAHHLARVCAALDRAGVALDVSVAAARRAARADVCVVSVVADAWEPWPLLAGSAAAVLSVFAPRNAAESARVLVPDGVLVTVTPAHDHLAELTEVMGMLTTPTGKLTRLHEDLGGHLELVDARDVRDARDVDRATARALAAMGPAAHHLDADELDGRAAALASRTRVTIAVQLARWRPRQAPSGASAPPFGASGPPSGAAGPLSAGPTGG